MISKNGLQAILLIAYNITLGLLALYTAFAVAYCYVAEEKGDALGAVDHLFDSFLKVTSFTSQLAHVVSNAYVKSLTAPRAPRVLGGVVQGGAAPGS